MSENRQVTEQAPSGLPQVIREYGQAFRGDWSSDTIDGRSVRDAMADLASWIEAPSDYPGDEAARHRLGVCPAGNGHWSWLYCDDECIASRATNVEARP